MAEKEERETILDVLHQRATGMDFSKRDVKVAVRKPRERQGSYATTVLIFGATAKHVLGLVERLKEEQVIAVVLVNAKKSRNFLERKTDVNNATWLAQLDAQNLLHGSSIPPEPIRHLRDLTRTRSSLVHDRTKVYQRMEKFLESTSTKIFAVVSTFALAPVSQVRISSCR